MQTYTILSYRVTQSTILKTGRFGLGTEDKNNEVIYPLYQTVQFLSVNSTICTYE